MINHPLPLLEIFIRLRRNFQIGTQEYLVALDALSKGFGSRKSFIFMCQTIWAKTKDEQEQVAEIINAFLPDELTEHEFDKLISQLKPSTETRQKDEVPETRQSTENNKPVEVSESKPVKPPEKDKPDKPPEDKSQNKSGQEAQNVSDSFSSWTETTPYGVNIGDAEIQNFQLDPNLDFIGSLPITRRQMKRAWRYYRRMRRTGPPVELDIRKTISQMHRTGTITKLVLIPRRCNMAHILILKDEGGSMTPFRYITRELLDSAIRSGIARVSIFYFHNVPGNHVFDDPMLRSQKTVNEAVGTFTNQGVLIISDAGSARGGYDMDRAEDTLRFIQIIRRVTLNIAWLNPTPRDRWEDTTADLIRNKCEIPMFTLDRAGLDQAVDVLRGQVS